MAEAKPNFDLFLGNDFDEIFKDDISCLQLLQLPTQELVKTGRKCLIRIMFQTNNPVIIAVRQDEALTHGQVLYGLIKPTKEMDQIESTAAMVNVIPKKRIYRMETIDELELFISELLKRPLVLQPSAHIGRGFSVINCAFYTREEKWILLINQINGKIRSKIEIGVQTARNWMNARVPFTLTISLNEYLQRIYFDHLTKAVLNPQFTFVEFTDAEIVIRYMGPRGTLLRKVEETRLTFDDLLPTETQRRGVTEAQSEWRNPALRVVMPDELNRYLPGWGFEQEDPFANLDQSEDELEEDEGAIGGLDVREQLMPPGAARNSGRGDEERPNTGRVIGRAQRKANQNRQHVPVELHVPNEGGPQRLDGDSPNKWEMPPPHYDDLQRGSRNQYQQEDRRYTASGAPRSPHLATSREPHPEEMNRNFAQQHLKSPRSPNYLPLPTSPHRSDNSSSPNRTASPKPGVHGNKYSRDNLQSPRTPSSPAMDMSRSPRTPTTPRTDRSYPHSPGSPNTPQFNPADRYNTEPASPYSPKRPQQTYLTDDNDDDGGFVDRVPRSRSQQQNERRYDSGYSRNTESSHPSDRHYDPKDRYNIPSSPRNASRFSPQDRNQSTFSDQPNNPPQRGNFPPSNRPIPTQRVLHHYQGSGRSDTTTSDSGFDDYDSSNKYSDFSVGKAPYYNRAFEKDMSPERDTNVNDILAQHKALAAKMINNNQGVPNTNSDKGHGYHGDSSYGRELQKWRRNINELEQAYDDTSVGFSRTTNLTNYPEQEQMAESFI